MIRWPKPWSLWGFFNPIWEEVPAKAKEAKRLAVEMILGAAMMAHMHRQTKNLIERIQVAAASSGQGRQGEGTTKLDSHANMVVLGNQCTIIQRKGRYVDVNVFASDVGLMSRVPIVDAALA